MKKKNQWLPAFVLATALLGFSGYANAQTETARPEVRQQAVEKTKQRTVPQIESDIKDLKDKIAAKQKVAGYDTKPYEQRLARLEEELKKAKAEQK